MNYEEALKNIKSTQKFGLKMGLERIKKLLKYMQNPEKNLKYFHVAGTNGKGSVCYCLANILSSCGYKTGLYISPSIHDYRERISINRKMISKENFVKLTCFVQNFLKNFKDDEVTEFEILTAMAFKYFSDEKCDFVVLETGMGGKFDATNVIENPLCSIITTISFDHTNLLGNSLSEIAKEKLGIVKRGSPLVLGENQSQVVYDLAKNKCKELGSRFYIADSKKIKNFKTESFNITSFDFEGNKLETSLSGNHQKSNISTVLKILSILKNKIYIPKNKLKMGFKNLKIPFRIQVINKSPLIIMDASHNVESVSALANFLRENLKNKRIIALCGMFKDKDAENSLKIIGKYFNEMIIVKSNCSRAMNVKELEKIAKKYSKCVCGFENFSEGIKYALNSLSKNDAFIIFGSFSIMDLAKKEILSLDKNKILY